VLTIKGEATATEHKQDERRHLREFAVTAAAGRIEFPLSVEGDQISATSANGILTVRIPKSANAQPKRIAVNGIIPSAE
jgi:HSP20 family protein